MSTGIRLALIALVVVLLLGAGAWFYLFGPNQVAAADLVPGDTLAFATIPNAARIVVDYQTSKLKSLVDNPQAQQAIDSIMDEIGPKNLKLVQDFLPELSGQSFIAVTHFDPAHPANVGIIAGLHPKPGAGNLDDFVNELKSAYPNLPSQGTTGDGEVDGLAYQWIKGPTAADKICLARHNGWIITAWGEDALRDWWERYQKKSTTPSLAQNPDYQKSIQRIGLDSETIFYFDYHHFIGIMENVMTRLNPKQGDLLTKRFEDFGPMALGSKFEHGEIADYGSMLVPREVQAKLGMSISPCPFETLKFTGPDTLLYYASSVDFAQGWQNFQDQTTANPVVGIVMKGLQSWAQSHNLDVQRNIIQPLGHEMSMQLEWDSSTTYPEAGLFVKLDKPDDFKPTIKAIIDSVRQALANAAVINELNSDGQNFAALKFVQALPISPTITEDGPYFGLFLTENQAVRSFKRDPSIDLATNSDFQRQIGARQNGASQIVFLDTPHLLNRAYDTARPMIPMAAMFNPTVSALMKNRQLPPDLHWLDSIGTWSFTATTDGDGVKFYSVSGVGNQGIFLFGGLGMGMAAINPLIHPQFTPAPAQPNLSAPPPPPMPGVVSPTPPSAPAPGATFTPTTPSTPPATTLAPSPAAPPAPQPPQAPAPSPPAPAALTNPPPVPAATTPPPSAPGSTPSENVSPVPATATNPPPTAPAPPSTNAATPGQ